MEDYNVWVKHVYFTRSAISANSQQEAEAVADKELENGGLCYGKEVLEMSDTTIDSVELAA